MDIRVLLQGQPSIEGEDTLRACCKSKSSEGDGTQYIPTNVRQLRSLKVSPKKTLGRQHGACNVW